MYDTILNLLCTRRFSAEGKKFPGALARRLRRNKTKSIQRPARLV